MSVACVGAPLRSAFHVSANARDGACLSAKRTEYVHTIYYIILPMI